MKTDYESPMKLSRVDGENGGLDVDKLFDIKDADGEKDNFKFQKFGLEVSSHNSITSKASPLSTSSARYVGSLYSHFTVTGDNCSLHQSLMRELITLLGARFY